MSSKKTLRIFISSPSDVRPERLIAARVVERLGREFSYHFKVEPVLWEREPLVATAHFQDKITPPAETDIVVVILWSRMGFPLPADKFPGPLSGKPVTGTEWEFENALKANRESPLKLPDLLMYRKKAAITGNLDDEAVIRQQLEQKRQVEEFIRTWFLDSKAQAFTAAFREFADASSFEDLLETHLREFLKRRLESPGDELVLSGISWHQGSPFLGLRSYELEHAPVFFGRTRARNELRELLGQQAQRGCAFVLVVGASGSGKSSLVKSGLLADLALPGMIGRVALVRYALMRPSDRDDDLVGALAAALLSKSALPEMQAPPLGDTVQTLSALLREAPGQAARPIRQGLALAGQACGLTELGEARLLVMVDQLEEMFTRDTVTPEERRAFVAALANLIASGLVWVVATMRSDFFDRLETEPELARISAEGRYLLVPPEAAELAQMITQPAREAGLRFEVDESSGTRLDEVIRAAAARDPAVLPLLSFLLEQLWQRRSENGVLTFSAYHALGGLEGSLGRQAEQLFCVLAPPVQAELNVVLRSLVTVSAKGQATARSAPLAAFAPGTPRRALVDALLHPQARLLVADGDGEGARVRVSHEAFLTHWERAGAQIAKDARDLELRGRLEEASERWREAERKDRGSLVLPPGLPLQEALGLLASWGPDLSADVRAYVLQSRQAARMRALRLALGAVGVALLLPLAAGIIGAVMIWQGVRAVEKEMSFVQVPPGCFQMGSPPAEPDRQDNESPQHQVCLKGFELGTFTVTQGEWSKVMLYKGNPSENKGNDRLPVETVNWDEARQFVWLMSLFGSHAYRLPTESEWEYAARAGTHTAKYWGDDNAGMCAYANVADLSYRKRWSSNATSLLAAQCDDGYAKTAPVGSYRPNAFGLHDMLGNVWQWVEDCNHDDYAGAPADGTAWQGPAGCLRVVRGGSWTYDSRYFRSARRVAFVADWRGSAGFRVVRDGP